MGVDEAREDQLVAGVDSPGRRAGQLGRERHDSPGAHADVGSGCALRPDDAAILDEEIIVMLHRCLSSRSP